MDGEIERQRQEAARRLPPLPVSRLTAHIEQDLSYRVKYTLGESLDMGDRLSEGLTELHQQNTRRAGSDPLLEQMLRRIEMTIVLGGTDGIARYMEHPFS